MVDQAKLIDMSTVKTCPSALFQLNLLRVSLNGLAEILIQWWPI